MIKNFPFSAYKGISRRAFLIGAGGVTISSILGYGIWNRLLPSIRLSSLSNIKRDGPFDVCILGSGPAGIALGRDLVSQGMKTLIIESGGNVMNSQQNVYVEGLDLYQSSGSVPYSVHTSRVRGLGGTTLLWTGRCSRFLPIDFEENAYTPKGAGWPIRYSDLEPYYDKAEKTLKVHGEPLSSYHAPRSYDLPPIEGMLTSQLRSEMKKIGIVIDGSPSSRAGARQNGPIRVARDMLPSLSKSTLITVVPHTTATRLIMEKGGRVGGVELRGLEGEEKTVVRAKTFIAACGAIETPRLLMLSRSSEFPEGVGNHSGILGRFFMEHPVIMFSGRVPDHIKLDKKQLGRSFQFYEEFKRDGYGSIRLSLANRKSKPKNLRIYATIEMWPSRENRVSLTPDRLNRFGDPGADLSLNFVKEDQRTFDRSRKLIRKIFSDLEAQEIEEKPMHWGHHHMGTCRMGMDPNNSVVDGNLLVHGTRNLYVLGSSVFVTSGAAHPTLAIVALGHRLAEHLKVSMN